MLILLLLGMVSKTVCTIETTLNDGHKTRTKINTHPKMCVYNTSLNLTLNAQTSSNHVYALFQHLLPCANLVREITPTTAVSVQNSANG